MARKLPTPTAKQEAIADGILSGMSVAQAQRIAGYSPTNGLAAKSAVVQNILDEARANLRRASNIKKADVVLGVLDAIDRARLAGEPNTEINGWKEVAKLLGHYAPEVKRIDLTLTQGRIKSKFEQMSDEELFEMASRNVLEGEFEVD
jgi:phage terminase small subunit